MNINLAALQLPCPEGARVLLSHDTALSDRVPDSFSALPRSGLYYSRWCIALKKIEKKEKRPDKCFKQHVHTWFRRPGRGN